MYFKELSVHFAFMTTKLLAEEKFVRCQDEYLSDRIAPQSFGRDVQTSD